MKQSGNLKDVRQKEREKDLSQLEKDSWLRLGDSGLKAETHGALRDV